MATLTPTRFICFRCNELITSSLEIRDYRNGIFLGPCCATLSETQAFLAPAGFSDNDLKGIVSLWLTQGPVLKAA